jgi:repressor LexA
MPARKLTDRQEEILTFVAVYIQEQERPPTIRDIAEHFGFTVKGAYDHLLALERKGWIGRDSKHSRGITVKEFPAGLKHLQLMRELSHEDIRSIPLVGRIAAGEPDAAIASADEKFIIGGDHVSGEELFALRVNGDSMAEAGIFKGDIVIVKRQPTARNRDIVVALIAGIEDEATLKRFFKKGNEIVLHPENSKYEDIVIQDSRRLQINGVVVGLYRSIK